MTPDIKLIALDMDGTLLAGDHTTIPQRNIDALRKAADKGVHIAIASGRSWSLIRETAQTLGAVSYGITANGAFVLDALTGEKLVKFPMDPGQCAQIITVLRRWGLSYELYVDGQNYVQTDEVEAAKRYALSDAFLDVFTRNMALVEDMHAFALQTFPEKFDIFYLPAQHREDIVRDCAATGPLAITGALADNLELTAHGVNKGRALAALAAKLGLTPDQVMAFGDADNDLEMLQWAGWSFAMANGTSGAKAAAKFVTSSNDDAGVAEGVEAYAL